MWYFSLLEWIRGKISFPVSYISHPPASCGYFQNMFRTPYEKPGPDLFSNRSACFCCPRSTSNIGYTYHIIIHTNKRLLLKGGPPRSVFKTIPPYCTLLTDCYSSISWCYPSLFYRRLPLIWNTPPPTSPSDLCLSLVYFIIVKLLDPTSRAMHHVIKNPLSYWHKVK